ncbi:hypothetical protein DFH06DRAFT_1326586 [Mycena polygramma]|nr:hypothetical protein DFH06DRAFT_1326586 [Mycena polygramma]
MHRVPRKRKSPDPRLFTRSTTDPGVHYYRDPVKGVYGDDNVTFVPPQSMPTGATAPAARSPSPPPRRRSPSPRRNNRGHPYSRTYSRSPTRSGEYRHEYGQQHRGAGYRSGPSHYQAARYRARTPEQGGSGSRYRDEGPRYGDHGDERGEVRGRERSFGARNPSPRRSPPRPPTEAPAPAGASKPSGHNDSKNNSGASRYLNAPLAAAFVITPPPSLLNAARNRRGHPMFPDDSEESEYEGSDVSDAPSRTAKYKKTEKARMLRVAKKAEASKAQPRAPLPRNTDALGIWYKVDIETYEDARNLLRWCNAGEPRARKLVLHLEQYYGIRSNLARSEGIAHVMAQQSASSRAYQLATTGTVPLKRGAREKSPFSDSEVTPLPDDVKAEDADMPPPSPRGPSFGNKGWVSAYLGVSPPGNAENFDILSSRASASEAIEYYFASPTDEWPPGMRTEDGVYPATKSEKPLLDDVRVACTLRHLLPEADGSSAGDAANMHVLEQTMLLFSITGMFAHYVTKGGLRFQARPIDENYNFDTRNVMFSHIASFMSTHGISIASDDVLALESYARSYRNRVAKNDDPANESFKSWPHDTSCIEMIDVNTIIKWADLDYGTLRPGLSSTYPRRPSAPHEDTAMDDVRPA